MSTPQPPALGPSSGTPPGSVKPSPIPDQVRVLIDVGTKAVERSISSRRRLGIVMDGLVPQLQEKFPEFNWETEGNWTLAREGGEGLSLRRSLLQSGIVDGDRLMLQEQFSSQVWRPVVEDSADGIQEAARRNFRNFGAATARALGMIAIVLSGLAVALLFVHSWMASSSVLWWLPPTTLVTICAVLAAFSARNRWGQRKLSYALTLAAMPLLFVTGFVLVPADGGQDGKFTAANILTGAVLVAIGSATMGRALHFGHTVLGAICSSAIVVGFISFLFAYTPLGKPAVPAIGVILGLVLATLADRWAHNLAGIKPDSLPPPGEEIDRAELDRGLDVDTFDDESTTELARNDRDTVVERWGINGTKLLTGLYFTAAATSTVAALTLIRADTRYYWGEVAMAVLSATILGLRARTKDDRVMAVIFYTASFITAVGTFLVIEATMTSNVGRLAVDAVAVLALSAFAVAGASLPKPKSEEPSDSEFRKLSSKAMGRIETFQTLSIFLVVMLALWVTRLFAFMRESNLLSSLK